MLIDHLEVHACRPGFLSPPPPLCPNMGLSKHGDPVFFGTMGSNPMEKDQCGCQSVGVAVIPCTLCSGV